MLKISELVGQELKWTQPQAFIMQYELQVGDALAATLEFQGNRAIAISGDGRWIFKRIDFLKNKTAIRTVRQDANLGVYEKKTWDKWGTLTLSDGSRYHTHSNSWLTQYSFRTERGKVLVDYQNIRGLFHVSADVTIHDEAKDIPEMSWIVILAWYLIVDMKSDSDFYIPVAG